MIGYSSNSIKYFHRIVEDYFVFAPWCSRGRPLRSHEGRYNVFPGHDFARLANTDGGLKPCPRCWKKPHA